VSDCQVRNGLDPHWKRETTTEWDVKGKEGRKEIKMEFVNRVGEK
jgi:hypothetical protein